MSAFRHAILSAISILITGVNICGGQLYEGSACEMKSGKPGICTKLPECKSIDDALRKRMFDFKNIVICSFVGETEVICCPDKVGTVPTANPSVFILNETTQEVFDFSMQPKWFQVQTSQPESSKSSTQAVNVERVITVGNIHITDEAEFIDLTQLIQKPMAVNNDRNPRLDIKPSVQSTSFFSRISTTTKRPSAKVRDLKITDSTTRWPSTSRTPRITVLKPVKSLSLQHMLPDSRKNDIKPWTQREEEISMPSRSPFWSGFNWRNSVASVKQTTSTQRPRPVRVRPNVDEVDFGTSSEEQSHFGANVNLWNESAPVWGSTTKVTTKRPSFPIISDSEKNANLDNWSNFVFPSDSYSQTGPSSPTFSSQPRVVTGATSTLSQSGINWPSSNPIISSPNPFTNTTPSAVTSVLDMWMINVLLEASGSTTLSSIPSLSSSSSSSSSSTPHQWSDFPNSPDDNNEISPSPTPRNPQATPPAPGSRVAERKAEKVCAQYQSEYLSLPKVLDFHILNGEPAFIGEFPHMAALGYPSEQKGQTTIVFNCGGSLISNRYVMTAAHCVNRPESLPTVIRLGTIILDESSGDMIDVGVEGVILYPEYRSARQYHDIALIRLNTTLTFTSRVIFPACLDTDRRDITPNENVIATGWGSTSVSTRQKSTLLLKVTLSTVELNECNQRHKDYAENRRLPDGLNDGQMCALDPNLKGDTCEGDSGGPLQVQLVNISKIIGITSFGISCGSSIPSVYARVAFYLDWLERIVWPDIAS